MNTFNLRSFLWILNFSIGIFRQEIWLNTTFLLKTTKKAHFSNENPARNFLDQENGNYIRKGLGGLVTFFCQVWYDVVVVVFFWK